MNIKNLAKFSIAVLAIMAILGLGRINPTLASPGMMDGMMGNPDRQAQNDNRSWFDRLFGQNDNNSGNYNRNPQPGPYGNDYYNNRTFTNDFTRRLDQDSNFRRDVINRLDNDDNFRQTFLSQIRDKGMIARLFADRFESDANFRRSVLNRFDNDANFRHNILSGLDNWMNNNPNYDYNQNRPY